MTFDPIESEFTSGLNQINSCDPDEPNEALITM